MLYNLKVTPEQLSVIEVALGTMSDAIKANGEEFAVNVNSNKVNEPINYVSCDKLEDIVKDIHFEIGLLTKY